MCAPDSVIGNALNLSVFNCGEQLHRVKSEILPSCEYSVKQTRSADAADESRQEEQSEGSKHSRYISV